MNGRVKFVLVAASVLAAALGVGWAVGLMGPREPPAAPGRERGAVLYASLCANCHGPDGHGDGPASFAQRPPPRDFASRPWRAGPSRESIRKAILDGVPETSMPALRSMLKDADADALAEHVLALADARPAGREPSADERLLREANFVDLRGTETPGLKLSDADGATLRLGSLKGKLVLLNFWGTSCVPCYEEMAQLAELERRLGGKGLAVVHVCADADAAAAQKAADRAKVRTFVEESGVGLARFEVQSLPAAWLVGPDGKPVARTQGARDWDAPAVRRLLERWLPGG